MSYDKLWLETNKAAAVGVLTCYLCASFYVSALWNVQNLHVYVPFSCKTK